ncbi:MAG: FHA domain-containing protein [Chloroflexi bacterium]|nr:FHA domain-containing protein [Chloroflexota bacterium]
MDRMNVTIDVQANDIGAKRANLRSSLLVGNLIATIRDKFNLDGEFQIRLEDSRQPLTPEAELETSGVTEGSVLICSRVVEASGTLEAIRRGARESLSKKYKRVYLQDERNLSEYDIAWQPAIVGRKEIRDPSKNRLLAVDLEDLEESYTVSRHHACLTEKDGSFFIESINERNATQLGATRLRFGAKYPLPAGSKIRVGRLNLTFYVIS